MKKIHLFKKEIKTCLHFVALAKKWFPGSSPRMTTGGEERYDPHAEFGVIASREKEKGFTLVETLVAIFILVVSITGPMAAAQNSLRSSFLARDQVVAYYLAQESIEYIKNAKDGLAVQGTDWKTQTPFDSCIGGNMQCDINSLGNRSVCGSGSINDNLKCKELDIDDANGFFIPSNPGGNSKYIRSIFMNNVGDETEVTVVIEWRTNLFVAGSKRIVVSENLYDWIPTN